MRISLLDEPEVGEARKQQLAELLADGASRKAIAETFGVNVDTITDWRKRPDVQSRVDAIQKDKAQRVMAHTDTAILKRLEAGTTKIPLKDLLEIRRTFAGSIVNVNPNDRAAATAELLKLLDSDPELARRFAAKLGASGDDPDA